MIIHTACFHLSYSYDEVCGPRPLTHHITHPTNVIPSPLSGRYPKVRIHTCNPKSITMNQLYGAFDEATHEWADGVLCTLFRRAAQDLSGAKNWVMFDGPVDALWIESMNTVPLPACVHM